MGPSAKSFSRSDFRLAGLRFLSFIMWTWKIKEKKCVRQVQYVYFVNLIFVRKYVFMFLLDFFFEGLYEALLHPMYRSLNK